MTQALQKHSSLKGLVHQLSNCEQAQYTVPSQASLLLVAFCLLWYRYLHVCTAVAHVQQQLC